MKRNNHRSISLFFLLCVSSLKCVSSFSHPNQAATRTTNTNTVAFQPRKVLVTKQRFTTLNSSSNNNDEDETDFNILDRFTSPKIDDAGLPLADSLLSQIVAPTMQITFLSIAHAPIPSWLYSTTSANSGMLFASSAPTSGLLIVPTLIHGAGLTVCWIMGCLAAKNFESDAFNVSGGRGYKTVILRLVQSGSFAVGILIFATQIDLLLEYGRYVQPGESEAIDFRLLNAIVEVINDIVFEAGVLSAWRIYRASLTANADGRPPDYKP